MKRILILLEDNYEELELWVPKVRLEEQGHQTIVAAPEENKQYKGKHGYPCTSEMSFENLQSQSFDGVLIPGGFSPDRIRRYRQVLDVVQQLDQEKKLIAFICHGGWVAISAKILNRRKATSTIAIYDDMVNAGCQWIDQSVVVDENLISSRTPKDLPAFCRAIVHALA